MIAMNFDNINVNFGDAHFLFIKTNFPEVVSESTQVIIKALLKQEKCVK